MDPRVSVDFMFDDDLGFVSNQSYLEEDKSVDFVPEHYPMSCVSVLVRRVNWRKKNMNTTVNGFTIYPKSYKKVSNLEFLKLQETVIRNITIQVA
mmetsp:Transcript_30523/g.60734  ORF Transcript_30523/g.60734 Transcript_30523/m.60734 type:complete len:95 (+) Transcript_30523:965-1249(+)